MYADELSRQGIDLGGKYYGQCKVLCPKCSHLRKKKKDPCLQVNIDKGVWKCWNGDCGWEGGIKQYVRPVPPKIKSYDTLYDYFNKRAISNSTVDYFRITYGKEWMPQTQQEERVMIFPYYRENQLINIKYRDSNKNFKMVKDAEKIPFNLDSIKDSEYAIFGEGEIESMSWHEIGLTSAVSCPNGANKGTNNLSWLDGCYDDFKDKKIYLATDNDEPGISLRDDLKRRFDLVFLITFPEGCKDGNDTLVAYGPQMLRKCFDEAKPVDLEYVESVQDCDIDDLFENGYPKGVGVDYQNLDNSFTIIRGLFGIVTGIPAHGKSTLLKQYIVRLSLRKNWKVAMISFEEKNKLSYARMIEQIVGKPIVGFNKMNANEFFAAKQMLIDSVLMMRIDGFKEFDIDYILGLFLTLIRRYGIDLFVIDPFNYIDLDDSETGTIGEVLKKINLFTKLHDCTIILVAHPRKMNKTGNSYHLPGLYDISGSHHFYNVPDFGITVYRDHSNGDIVEVHILKIKHHFLGNAPAVIQFEFDRSTGRYKEYGTRWETELNQKQNNLL